MSVARSPSSSSGAASPPPDYLAKDYDSFRSLMLERLALTVPGWQERHAADIGIAMVEVLAYAADLLSYRQDAVALEAYLDTAVSRISVRRHARLLSYRLNDGCNARALVWVRLDVPGVLLPAGTAFATGISGQSVVIDPPTLLEPAVLENCVVFESLVATRLVREHNQMAVLDVDPTRAVLDGRFPLLTPGAFLVLSPLVPRGLPSSNHPVRIETVEATSEAQGRPTTTVTWNGDDRFEPGTAQWIAHGNIVLVDHGRTVTERLPPLDGHRHARLAVPELTHRIPIADDIPAQSLQFQDPSRAVPAVTVRFGDSEWHPSADLLENGRFDRCFIVETETDGSSQLRFGDGLHGAVPPRGIPPEVSYRVGNGQQGNVSAAEIRHIVTDVVAFAGISEVTNLDAARGGTDPDTIAEAKLLAPSAYESNTERCVTAADYVQCVRANPSVADASARIERRGLRSTVKIYVRTNLAPANAILHDVRRQLESRRPIGHDIDVRPAQYLDVRLDLAVVIQPGYPAPVIAQTIRTALGVVGEVPGRIFADGMLGIGRSLRSDEVLLAVQRLPGVVEVSILTLEPVDRNEPSTSDLVEAHPGEVIRLVGAGGHAAPEPTVGVKVEVAQ